MTSKALSERRDQQSSGSPLLVRAEHLLDELKEVSKAIAARAYEFFEGRGHEPGKDLEDWLRAESELLRPVPLEITETDNRLTVRAEVPGFTAEQIRLSVEPHRLIISAKAEERKEGTSHTERHSRDVFRALELDSEVDSENVTGGLKGGILSIVLPKVHRAEPSHIGTGSGEQPEVRAVTIK
jgi:HSP20 family protein